MGTQIVQPVHVPHTSVYAIGELTTFTTAEGGTTAQLTDATAWVPKQMRRLFKQIDSFMERTMKTPDWVNGLMNVRAKEAEEQGKATAWKRMGGTAPGEPGDGGLDNAKPKAPGKAAKWNPKNRSLEKPPRQHIDDRANFDDGKDNKTRPIGTQARFETTHGGRSRS